MIRPALLFVSLCLLVPVTFSSCLSQATSSAQVTKTIGNLKVNIRSTNTGMIQGGIMTRSSSDGDNSQTTFQLPGGTTLQIENDVIRLDGQEVGKVTPASKNLDVKAVDGEVTIELDGVRLALPTPAEEG